jgi:hypothetical protein
MIKKHRIANLIDVDDSNHSGRNELSRNTLQRPIAVRPIAVRPSDELYAETEKANIPFQCVHLAVQDVYQWESLWVHRMHEKDPMENNDDCDAEEENVIIAFDIERERGARNPSPEGPEMRVGKRSLPKPYVASDHQDRTLENMEHHPQTIVPLYRPVAMRVGAAMIEPHVPRRPVEPTYVIPREIKQDDTRSLSPITASDCISRRSGDSGASIKSSLSRPLQSRAFRDPNGVHIIPEDDYCVEFPQRMVIAPKPQSAVLQQARENLLYQLAVSRGETDSPAFLDCLSILEQQYNANLASESVDYSYAEHVGTWLTLTKPTFFGCLGDNDAGDPMYSLGRMTFDMFTPSALICSLQGNFNTVHPVTEVPEGLIAQVGTDPSVLRTYK